MTAHNTLTTEQFIGRAKRVHGDKYDYSLVDYKNQFSPITIICPEHGSFEQVPKYHISGHGCKKCGQKGKPRKEQVNSTKSFIKKARKVHGAKYAYDKVDYVATRTKVIIFCPEHGYFEQTPEVHLAGRGCPTCGKKQCSKSKRLTTEEFVALAKRVHGSEYSYRNTEYNHVYDAVTITCKKHGDFRQRAHDHLNGCGCPKCAKESTGSRIESKVDRLLNKLGITYKREQTFDWLVHKAPLRLDFYIPSMNLAIECQGKQHFFASTGMFSYENLAKTRERDSIKYKLLKTYGVNIVYVVDFVEYTIDSLVADYEPIIHFNSLKNYLEEFSAKSPNCQETM